jgi:hypothetical protein
MAKLPSLQFYPGDWLRDSVSGCSLAAQGLWLRLMILMHDSERYGYLCNNGLPIPSDQLARRCGSTLAEYEELMLELESAGVPSRTKDGIIYSRRMTRDAEERARNAERQRKHYESKKEKPNRQPNRQPNTKPNGNLTATSQKSHNPSSSSYSDTKVSDDSVPGSLNGGPGLRKAPESESRQSSAPPRELSIWDWGWRVLHDLTESRARGLLGKKIKEFGEGEVMAALRRTEKASTASPSEYFCGVLKPKAVAAPQKVV